MAHAPAAGLLSAIKASAVKAGASGLAKTAATGLAKSAGLAAAKKIPLVGQAVSGVSNIGGGLQGIPGAGKEILQGNIRSGVNDLFKSLGDINQGQLQLKSLRQQAPEEIGGSLLKGGVLGLDQLTGGLIGQKKKNQLRGQLGVGPLSQSDSAVFNATSLGDILFPSFNPDQGRLLDMIDQAASRRPR